MARLNRRKLQNAQNVENTAKDSSKCCTPIVEVDLKPFSPKKAQKTIFRNDIPKEKNLDLPKQTMVLRTCKLKSLKKPDSSTCRIVGNGLKTTTKNTVSKDLTSIAGEQCRKSVNTRSNLINSGTNDKRPRNKPVTRTVVTKLNNKNSEPQQGDSIKRIKPKGTDLNSNENKHLPDTKILRKRKLLDYKERSSIETPENSLSAKVPIYRQNIPKPAKSSKRDPFAFILESDEEENSDISFKINSPKKRKIAHVKPLETVKNTNKKFKKTNVIKYNDKINNTLNSIRTKFNKKNDLGSSNVKKPSDDAKSSRVGTGVSIFNSTQINNVQNLSTLGESHADISVVLNAENTLKKSSAIFTSNRNEDVDINSTKSLSRISFRNNSAKTQSGNINIIQNCVLNTSNSNSSTKKQVNRVGGGWRFETDIMTRNPHLIAVNSNGLPVLSQDPILDHTFDDKIKKMSCTIKNPETRSSPKQQSILNYIATSNEYSKEPIQRQSLYDIDEFSPLKFSDKENAGEKKQLPTERAKRNILGQLDSNTLTSTPNKNVPFDAPQFDVSIRKPDFEPTNQMETLNFSSDSIDQNIETTKNSGAKPFRLEVNFKQYKPKRGPHMITKPLRDSEVERLIEKDDGYDNMVENHELEKEECGLFEDIDAPESDTRSYKPRTKKHLPDHNSPKKKNPAKLSKEALKWIKEFNQMCDEVDQTELEIA